MKHLLYIKSRVGTYAVEQFENFEEILQVALRPKPLVLIDSVVLNIYKKHISLVSPDIKFYPILATEEAKSFQNLTPIILWLLENELRRDGSLLVIGGGVLQDIGCFIASIVFRGVPWAFIPTTLLSQCDSCIGSKSSINFLSYKNQIGSFHPPQRVYLSPFFLKTLPKDEIHSGIGEVIKLHLIEGESAFAWVMDQLTNHKDLHLERIVQSSLQIKQKYIEEDELDRGVRNLLNYGHTFGHAYESATNFAIPHGISVLLGILTSTHLSVKRRMVTPEYFESLREKLRPWYSPFHLKLQAMNRASLLHAIRSDKKNSGTGLFCILSRGPGKIEKVQVDVDQLPEEIDEFCFLMGGF